MKTFLLILCLLITQLLYGQDTLHANRLKIIGEETYRVINKNTCPIVIVADEVQFQLGDDKIIVPASTNIIKLVDGGKKVTYYLFTVYFIKAVAFYNKDNEIIKFGMLDMNETWYMFYSTTLRT